MVQGLMMMLAFRCCMRIIVDMLLVKLKEVREAGEGWEEVEPSVVSGKI